MKIILITFFLLSSTSLWAGLTHPNCYSSSDFSAKIKVEKLARQAEKKGFFMKKRTFKKARRINVGSLQMCEFGKNRPCKVLGFDEVWAGGDYHCLCVKAKFLEGKIIGSGERARDTACISVDQVHPHKN